MKDPHAIDLRALQSAVSELARAKPVAGKVRRAIERSGVPYSSDPIELAAEALSALSRAPLAPTLDETRRSIRAIDGASNARCRHGRSAIERK